MAYAAADFSVSDQLTHVDPLEPVATLVESGRSAQAAQLLRDIIARDPLNHGALRDLALLSLDEGDLPGARDAIGRSLLLRPGDTEYLTIRAETSRRAGDLAEARRYLAEGLAKEPTNHEALTSAGLVEADDGRYAAAETLFMRALDAKADYIDAIYNLARLKARTKLPDEAERWLARARLLRPQDRRFHVPANQILLPPVQRPPEPSATAPLREGPDPSYAALETALRSGTIVPIPDSNILGSPSSPIFSATDANQLFAPLAGLAALTLWLAPFTEGAIATVVLLVIYQWTMPRFVARKLARRIIATPIGTEPGTWERLWKTGGLVLYVPATGQRIQAPEQKWRDAIASTIPIFPKT